MRFKDIKGDDFKIIFGFEEDKIIHLGEYFSCPDRFLDPYSIYIPINHSEKMITDKLESNAKTIFSNCDEYNQEELNLRYDEIVTATLLKEIHISLQPAYKIKSDPCPNMSDLPTNSRQVEGSCKGIYLNAKDLLKISLEKTKTIMNDLDEKIILLEKTPKLSSEESSIKSFIKKAHDALIESSNGCIEDIQKMEDFSKTKKNMICINGHIKKHENINPIKKFDLKKISFG